MGLLNKLTSQGSTLSQFDGGDQNKYGVSPGSNSKLHYEYSINGNPSQQKKPSPSTLDLDGKTPVGYQSPEVGIPVSRLNDITG